MSHIFLHHWNLHISHFDANQNHTFYFLCCNTDLLSPSQPLAVSKEHPEIPQQDGESEVKKMIKMLEQQAASILQGN